jgi:hypothetical protein
MYTFLIKLSEWLYKQSKGFAVLLFLVLEILFAGLILPHMQLKMGDGQSSPKPLDLYFGFTQEEADAFLSSLSPAGRATYLQVETLIDSIYPIVYTLLFVLTISYFFKRAISPNSLLLLFNLFPILTFLADLTENAGIITLLLSYPTSSPVAAQLANIGNHVKWITSAGTVLLLLTGIIIWGSKLLSQKQNPSKS